MGYEIDTGFPVTERSAGRWARIRERPAWRAVAAGVLAVCLVGAGVGGYLIGNSPEADLDAVRAAAAAQGREEGSAAGAEEGYDQGFEAAQQRNYAAAYAAAYEKAYAAEFESVGLDPPERIPVPERP
jgi:hypothetical protein